METNPSGKNEGTANGQPLTPEQKRMSRREALARVGFKAAAAAVAALTADDLLRLTGRAMEQHAGDNEIARKVAQEFKNAGVAHAGASGFLCKAFGCPGCASLPSGYKCISCNVVCGMPGFNCPGTVGDDEHITCCTNMYNACLKAGKSQADCQGMQEYCNRNS